MKRLVLAAIVLVMALAGAAGPASAHGIHKAPIDDRLNIGIMDEAIYNNAYSMNAAQIQAFLEAREPGACSGYCLKNYVVPDTGELFSVFLNRVAKQWNMNPQVILSTLQKEQSLVTSTSATASQINFAMGYGCPEGPGCNSALAGMYNQVFYATKYLRAGQLYSCGDRTSMPGYSFSTQWRVGNGVAIDGKPTRIGTCATGALYPYTPHRPDSAYLTAANGSHYYGNYNFIANFQSWFGATLGQPYSAQWAGQSPGPTVGAGGQAQVWIEFKNVGQTTWTQDTVKLGTTRPNDRGSGFAHSGMSLGSGWLSDTRVRMDQATVGPGQVARFTFTVTGNPGPGMYHEYFRPVAEGITWMEDYGVHLPITVLPSFTAEWAGQSAYPSAAPGTDAPALIEFRNTGTATWSKTGTMPVRLGTDNPRDRASLISSGWLSPSRIEMDQASVTPGQVARFSFNARAPFSGTFREYFRPVAEGYTWFGNPNEVSLDVIGQTYSAQWVNQSYPASLIGLPQTAWLEFRNIGTAAWSRTGPHPIRIGTDRPRDRASAFVSGWLSPSRVQLDQSSVAPGQVGRFTFLLNSPVPGTYDEYFRPVAEGLHWLEDFGVFFRLNVTGS